MIHNCSCLQIILKLIVSHNLLINLDHINIECLIFQTKLWKMCELVNEFVKCISHKFIYL